MVTISKYYSSVTKTGVRPSNPGNVVTVIPEVLNPPDSPVSHNPVTIGSPANGLSLVGQELSLGLASSGVTGALSGTDWSTFNGKIGGTIASGQVAFGTGVNTVGGDSGLVWDNVNKRLGVGVTPIEKLQLSGRVLATNNYTNTSDLPIISSGNISGYNIRTTSSGRFSIITNYFAANTTSILLGTGVNNPTSNVLTFDHTNIRAGITTDSPTNTLDVNGTTRIRSISNAVGNFLTTSATGVVQQRTATETLGDIGAMPDQAVERASDTVIFDNDYIIGNAVARTGNILFDFTGAKLGSVTRMIHNSGTKPTIPATAVLLSGSYVVSVNNYIWFVITKTSATQVVEVTISQVQTW